MRVLVRAFWHVRARIAEVGAARALREHARLTRAAEKFFRRRDAA